MKFKEIFTRYTFFILGIWLLSLGSALSVKANLGISTISTLPFVLSLTEKLTIGQFTIVFHFVMVLLQIILLRKRFKPIHLIQLPVAFLFGYLVDFSIYITSWLTPAVYHYRFILMLISCVLAAVGVSMELAADVIVLPPEGATNAIADVTKIEFGKIKIGFDAAVVALSCIFSIYFFDTIHGVREGTLVAVFLVGGIARKMLPFMQKLIEKILTPVPEYS